MKFRLLKQCILYIIQIVMASLLSFLLINKATLNGDNGVSLSIFIKQGVLSLYSADYIGNHYFDFVKVIMILGLFFISFYSTISLSADLSDGARNIIKIHSNSRIKYEIGLVNLITLQYIREYIKLIAVITTTYFVVYNFEFDITSSILIYIELFLLEWILFIISQLVSKNSLIVFICSFTIFLLQGTLLANLIIALFICVALFFISVSELGSKLRGDES